MNQNHTHITGSFKSAAKLILVLLVSLSGSAVLYAQPAPSPVTAPTALMDRLNGSTWNWTATGSVSSTSKSTVTFRGTTMDYSWGGSGTLSPTDDPVTIQLKTTDGIVLRMRFDPFTTKFDVLQDNGGIVAQGRKPTEKITPAPAPSGTAATPERQIKLKTGWDGPMQGGSKTLQDLANVLNGFGKPDANPAFVDTEMFNGVRYLMPVTEAVAALGLNQRLPAAKKVVCPGLPKDCFNYISFDGVFEGHFNRLDLVVDSANQVVSIQLVDEHPKDTSSSYSGEGDWLTFNFVGYRVKAMNYMKVQYRTSELRPHLVYSNGQRQNTMRWDDPHEMPSKEPGVCRKVDAFLRNKEHKALEQSEWFVPKPLADLIMVCIGKGQR